jgi:hypothetical protein
MVSTARDVVDMGRPDPTASLDTSQATGKLSGGEFMSQRLAGLVAAVFELPTLEGLDELLAELETLPRDQAVAGLIDDLLDYRVVLAQRVVPAERPAVAA